MSDNFSESVSLYVAGKYFGIIRGNPVRVLDTFSNMVGEGRKGKMTVFLFFALVVAWGGVCGQTTQLLKTIPDL